MGKDTKGRRHKENIMRMPNGSYRVRIMLNGKRVDKRFKKLTEAQNWLVDQKYATQHETIPIKKEMTCDEWFETWMAEVNKNLAPNTRRNYNNRYYFNCQSVIGNLPLNKVRQIHCIRIFNS